jgi:hypothetical protein
MIEARYRDDLAELPGSNSRQILADWYQYRRFDHRV